MVLADASVLVFTSPVLTFFLGAVLLNERIEAVSLACALASTVGLVCVVGPTFLFGTQPSDYPRHASAVAITAALLAAVAQSFLYITVRKLQRFHPLVVAHYLALFSAGGALTYISIIQKTVKLPTSSYHWAAVISSGGFAFAGQLALTRGFQLKQAGIVAVMRYLDVVCVFIWNSTLLREPINPWSIVGTIVICGAATTIARQVTRRACEREEK